MKSIYRGGRLLGSFFLQTSTTKKQLIKIVFASFVNRHILDINFVLKKFKCLKSAIVSISSDHRLTYLLREINVNETGIYHCKAKNFKTIFSLPLWREAL